MRVFVFYMHRPAWLHSDSAVPLCSWMSTCLSVARPLCDCLPACGHLFTSSSISRHGCKPHHPTPTLWPQDPSPPRPAFSTPLSCFPQTPAVNHLCLSCSPPHAALSYLRPAWHSLWNCRSTLQFVPVCCWPTNISFKYCMLSETGEISIQVWRKQIRWEVLHMAKWERDRQIEFWIHPLFMFIILQEMASRLEHMWSYTDL